MARTLGAKSIEERVEGFPAGKRHKALIDMTRAELCREADRLHRRCLALIQLLPDDSKATLRKVDGADLIDQLADLESQIS
jgi:hypothetical protein